MGPNIVLTDLTVRIAVEIVTELLSLILIKVEFHSHPLSVRSPGEERDRLLHQGIDFHSAVVHCPITIRTFYPVTPNNLAINAWALAPQDESADNRALRLDSFLTFLGPGGFATPDDVEALESCQRGFANREVAWSDISKGMNRDEALLNDELQMRAFWRKWHRLMMQHPAAQGVR